MLEGFDLAYQEWGFGIWFLNAFALYCAVGFIWTWFWFHGLKRRVDGGDVAAVPRFNKAIQGFPNAVFAKMMGLGPIEQEEAG